MSRPLSRCTGDHDFAVAPVATHAWLRACETYQAGIRQSSAGGGRLTLPRSSTAAEGGIAGIRSRDLGKGAAYANLPRDGRGHSAFGKRSFQLREDVRRNHKSAGSCQGLGPKIEVPRARFRDPGDDDAMVIRTVFAQTQVRRFVGIDTGAH